MVVRPVQRPCRIGRSRVSQNRSGLVERRGRETHFASKCRKIHVLLALLVTGTLLLLYYIHDVSREVTKQSYWLVSKADAMEFARKKSTKLYNDDLYSPSHVNFDDIVVARVLPFNMSAKDVILFVHIQKTAGW